jgi:hypothetical protein
MEPLDDVGGQKQRHTPVADCVGGVDQPAGDQASPHPGQLPKPGLDVTAHQIGLRVDVAMRLGDTSSDQKQQDGGDDRNDERGLPAEVRHQCQCDGSRQNVAQ